MSCIISRKSCYLHIVYIASIAIYIYFVILQMLLSKATYNWGIQKAIRLE